VEEANFSKLDNNNIILDSVIEKREYKLLNSFRNYLQLSIVYFVLFNLLIGIPFYILPVVNIYCQMIGCIYHLFMMVFAPSLPIIFLPVLISIQIKQFRTLSEVEREWGDKRRNSIRKTIFRIILSMEVIITVLITIETIIYLTRDSLSIHHVFTFYLTIIIGILIIGSIFLFKKPFNILLKQNNCTIKIVLPYFMIANLVISLAVQLTKDIIYLTAGYSYVNDTLCMVELGSQLLFGILGIGLILEILIKTGKALKFVNRLHTLK